MDSEEKAEKLPRQDISLTTSFEIREAAADRWLSFSLKKVGTQQLFRRFPSQLFFEQPNKWYIMASPSQ